MSLLGTSLLVGSVVLVAAAVLTGVLAGVVVEARARRALHHLRRVVDGAPDALLGVDMSGRISFANARASEMLGYAHHELLAMNVDELVPAALRSGHARRRAAYGAAARPRPMGTGMTLRARCRDGSELPVEISLAPLSGSSQTILATIRDVRDRLAAEAATRELGDRLRAIADNSDAAIFVKDLEGRYLLANPAFEALVGRDDGGTLGCDDRELLGDAAEPLIEHDARAVQARRALRFEEVIAGRDLLSVRFPLLGAGGEVVGVGGTATDVTALKDTARIAADAEAQFRLMLEAAPTAIVGVGDDRRIVFVNRCAEEQIGATADTLVGAPVSDLWPEEAAERYSAWLDALPKDEGAVAAPPITVRRADGSTFRAALSLSWVRQGDRAPLLVIAGGDAGDRASVEDEAPAPAAVEAERVPPLTGEVRRQAREQEAIASIGLRALEERDPQRVTDAAVGIVRDVLNVEFAAVMAPVSGGAQMAVQSADGWPGDDEPLLLPGGHESHCGYTLMEGAPVVSADLRKETRFAFPDVLRASGMRSGAGVPIGRGAEPYGVLVVHSAQVREYPSHEIHFLQAVAHVVAQSMERRRSDDEVRERALEDPLTGLPNRVLLNDRLEHALASARRRLTQTAVLFIDLDRFKVINDSLGHAAGDELLISLAPRLRAALRPSDTVARFGGDEFIVLCPDLAGTQDAFVLGERLLAAISQPVTIKGRTVSVSASVGIALDAGGVSTAEALLRDADAAMYRAKDRGRGRVELFDERLRAQSMRRLVVEGELREALELGELRVYYQPIVDLATGRIAALESLLRWEHPRRGLLGPVEFIGIAEESGLIVQMGRWALEQALRDLATWRATRQGRTLRLSANLSARELAAGDTPAFTRRALDAVGLAPSVLSLEVTESLLVGESDPVLEVLDQLRRSGIGLTLDDFGRGYASLGYLQRMPLDGLKIDRSFIASVADDRKAHAIVAAVIQMAHALGLAVTAEGLEFHPQVEALAQLGCDRGQGYFYSRAVPASEVMAVLDGAGGPTRGSG